MNIGPYYSTLVARDKGSILVMLTRGWVLPIL